VPHQRPHRIRPRIAVDLDHDDRFRGIQQSAGLSDRGEHRIVDRRDPVRWRTAGDDVGESHEWLGEDRGSRIVQSGRPFRQT